MYLAKTSDAGVVGTMLDHRFSFRDKLSVDIVLEQFKQHLFQALIDRIGGVLHQSLCLFSLSKARRPQNGMK